MLDVDREVLEVAAIARIVDGRLLAAALPGRNTRDLLPRLRALPITEALGAGVSMHPVLADAIRDRLKTMAPNRYRQLVRRIAEHLATRARLGHMDALIELSLLIEDPVYRQSIGNEPSRRCYPDQPRPGEFEDFGRQHGFDEGPDWAELTAWRQAGIAELVLRRIDGGVLLWDCFAPLSEVPEAGPLTASLRSTGRHVEADPSRSFAAVTLFADTTIDERAEAQRLSSGAFMRHIAMPELDGKKTTTVEVTEKDANGKETEEEPPKEVKECPGNKCDAEMRDPNYVMSEPLTAAQLAAVLDRLNWATRPGPDDGDFTGSVDLEALAGRMNSYALFTSEAVTILSVSGPPRFNPGNIDFDPTLDDLAGIGGTQPPIHNPDGSVSWSDGQGNQAR